MTKKEHTHKKYVLLPPKLAESDTLSLGHGLCGSVCSIYNKETIQNTLSVHMLEITKIDPEIHHLMV
jgi:hypothetical protein